MYVGWPCPQHEGGTAEESALRFDHARARRVLVLPVLFDEATKTRHQAIEIMRRLDAAGIDSVLAHLPGCDESTALPAEQSIAGWGKAVAAAAQHFAATHALAIRRRRQRGTNVGFRRSRADIAAVLAAFRGPMRILLADADRTAQIFAENWDKADPRVARCPRAGHAYVEPHARDWLREQLLAALRG